MNMSEEELDKYQECVDFICLRCIAPTLDYPEICDSCPVRKSMDCYTHTINVKRHYKIDILQGE